MTIATSWFIRYQPITVDDYVFENQSQKDQVNIWINDGFIPGNIILYGPAGTGKTALSEIIIRSIIKSQHDLNNVTDLGVKNIDELTSWLEKRPVKSKQKIVYLEEFDRLSSQAANSLKNRKMEKYQSTCAFICTTNFFNRVERALQTRFTHQFNMNNPNKEGVIYRLQQILAAEGVSFDLEKLKEFVDKNLHIGLRDLINTLQVNTINNEIDLNKIVLQKSEQEEEIIIQTKNILYTLTKLQDINDKKLCIVDPMNSKIAQYYSALIQIVQYNHNIDYLNVFLRLDEEINYLPFKRHINIYLSQLENKRLMPHIHYLAFLYECMRTVIEINV